eukprot:gene5752-9013_t
MADSDSGSYVGWVDDQKQRILVPASSMKFIIRRKDGTFDVSFIEDISDTNVKELSVFRSLDDAHAWLTH